MLRYFQEKFKSLTGVSPVLFYGRGVFNYSFGFLPHREPINTVRKYEIFLSIHGRSVNFFPFVPKQCDLHVVIFSGFAYSYSPECVTITRRD